MELAQRMLCDNNANYEDLLSNVLLSKNTLKCDDTNVAYGPSIQILTKLFKDGDPENDIPWGLWRDQSDNCLNREVDDPKGYFKSCFKDMIFHYFKSDCRYGSYPYKITFNQCTAKGYNLTGISPTVNSGDEELFSKVADALAAYLGNNLVGKSFNDTLEILDALCQILKERAELDRILKKTVLAVE